jgi:hypothetical protein
MLCNQSRSSNPYSHLSQPSRTSSRVSLLLTRLEAPVFLQDFADLAFSPQKGQAIVQAGVLAGRRVRLGRGILRTMPEKQRLQLPAELLPS